METGSFAPQKFLLEKVALPLEDAHLANRARV